MANFRKRPTGWQYRVSYKDENGKYRRVAKGGFTTKKEAQLAANKLEEEIHSGITLRAKDTLFSDYFDEWYKVYKEPFVSLKTKKNYVITSDIIKRQCKQIKLSDLTEEYYQSFLNDYALDPLTKKKRAKETVAKVNVHISACLKRAVKTGLIRYNPADDVIVGGYVKSKQDMVNFLNLEEIKLLQKELLSSLDPKYVSPYLLLLSLLTGFRYSEVIALTWDDIDFKNKTIRVNKSWDNTHSFSFVPTKTTSSNRIITMTDEVFPFLIQLRQRQIEQKWNYNNLIFSVNGTHPPSSNAVNKSLHRALKRAGVTKRITHQGLRHSHVSLLLFKGVNIKYISRRVGHSDASTTLNKYSHIIDEMEQLESQKVDLIFENMN